MQVNNETVNLSPSIAKVLITKTPLHAWQAHRLLGGGTGKTTEAMVAGNIYEAFVFGDTSKLVSIPFGDYKKDAAKFLRDQALAAKKIPILAEDWPIYQAEAAEMLKGIHKAGIVFEGGEFQKIILWKSNGIDCKAVLDYFILGPNYYINFDLKCVEDASAFKITKAITEYGWDTQKAAYTEAIETIHPEMAGRGKYVLVVCEKAKPFAVNVVEFSGGFNELGRRKWERAKALWKPCIESGNWPGYSPTTVDPLPWQMTAVESVEAE